MIQEITTAAIEYFRTVDFPVLAKEIGTLENDLYGSLADKYMLAWDALEQLGKSSSMIIKYATYVMDEDYAPTLDNLEKEQAGYTNKFKKADSTTATEELADGYALSINPGLMDNIENAFANKVPVIFDSFKGVSRNIEKLLTVMEYILGRKNFIVTTNYLISNGNIERRAKLLKPCHNMDEMIANWKNPAGLTAIHKWWLEIAARGH